MKPKRLILSRKGFDGGSGGCPSPIFCDDTMFSLPIPDKSSTVTYENILHEGRDIGKLVTDLTCGRRDPQKRIKATCGAHLDPDINPQSHQHSLDVWRGVFGTSRGAQGHLDREKVSVGDLFLFFGLYKRVERTDGQWRFARGQRKKHIVWGWLQVEKIYSVGDTVADRHRARAEFPWAARHPHLSDGYEHSNNTLYIASGVLDLGDGPIATGAGVFSRFDERLVLTEPGKAVSRWRLPRWFYPSDSKTPLTSHDPERTKSNRWNPEPDDDYAYLQSVPRGQEFVLHLEDYPEALPWVSSLICNHGQS